MVITVTICHRSNRDFNKQIPEASEKNKWNKQISKIHIGKEEVQNPKSRFQFHQIPSIHSLKIFKIS